MRDQKNNFRSLEIWILVGIIFYMLALYSIPLQSKAFYFDDSSVVGNQAIKTIDLPRIFDAFNTRALVGLSFALNYKLCAIHPAGYRFINLLIHCLNAFLVYLLIRTTLYLYPARKPVFSCPLEWPAFFASMLFLCHPVQTEAVNFIFQRFVLMGTFFYLLTLYLYIQYRCQSKNRYLIASLGFAIAAMFCKEFTVTLPVMLVLYEFYFINVKAESWQKRYRRILPFFIIVLIVPILLFRTPPQAIWVANIADSDSIHHVDITRARHSVSRRQYFLTELNVVCTYIRLLFLPVDQNVDYDYPLSQGMGGKTALCGVFLLCILALAAVTYRSYRIISFSILWFFIALSVESSFIPIGNVINEYRLYLASVGFVLFMMTLIYTRRMDVQKLNMIAAAVLIGCSILTYQRNKVWKDEFTFWEDAVQRSPHKARQHYTLGFAYFYQGRFTEAIPYLNEAIDIKPDYVEAYVNRGIIYSEEGKLAEALSDFNKAIQINPDVAGSYYNRGNVFMKQNNFSQALSDYNKAIELNPGYAEAYTNRGSIYDRQGFFTQALFNYNKAIAIYPRVKFPTDLDIWIDGLKKASVGDVSRSHDNNYADAYYNRGCVYDRMGRFTQALSDYNMAVKINSNDADAYNNRGHIFSRQGNYMQALPDYNKAIEINPGIAGYYYNRAIAYYESREYVKALGDVHRVEALGVAVNPEFLSALNKAL